MIITVYSFLMAVFWCDIFVLISSLLRRRNEFIIHLSVFPLLFLMITSIIRLFCTFEFPFVHEVPSMVIFPAIQRFVGTVVYIFDDYIINVSDILIVIWIAGSIFAITKVVRDCVVFHRIANELPETKDEKIKMVMDEIIRQNKPGMEVKIIQSRYIDSPKMSGFFNLTIYLPDVMFTDAELKSVLLHEWNHFIYKDSWIKLIVHIICAVFWWNPIIYLLKHDLDHTLEIKSDFKITTPLTKDARIEYLQTIVKVMKHSEGVNRGFALPPFGAGLVSAKNGNKTKQRFRLVLNSNPKDSLLLKLLFYGLTLAILVPSFLFVVQPYTPVPIESGGFFVTPDNSYLVANQDGSYSVYTDGQYKFDINDITCDPYSSMKVR